MYVHLVLITLRPKTKTRTENKIFRLYQRLQEACGGTEAGILYFNVSKNLDQRKGVTWVELALFRDESSFQRYREHPAHKEIADQLQKVADWQVGDYTDTLFLETLLNN